MKTRLPDTPDVPVIRTDFSDQDAWERVKAAISWVSPDDFQANVSYIDDHAFAEVTVSELLECGLDRGKHALMLIVDEITISSPEHPVLVVNLALPIGRRRRGVGRWFRAVPHTISIMEANLTTGNTDWHSFADYLDADGVYRECGLYGRVEDLPGNQVTE